MNKVYVDQIRERDWVESVFLVREKIMGMAKNGKAYLTLKLMDRTGEVEGRIWDRVEELDRCFQRDDFIRVGARASVYMTRMQLVVQELEKLDDDAVDLTDFLPASARPVDVMVEELSALVGALSDRHLKALMMAFLDDHEFMACYTKAPAAKAMHHVYLGGLLEHSLAVATLAGDISERYPDLNCDLLIVGALLHDVGKVAELRYTRSFEYTDAGKLLGHIMIGVEIVEDKLRSLPEFPVDLAIHLKHLLLSHHGEYEYGSPKRPKTLEAVILNFLDDLDSKINGVRTHIEKEPNNDSPWTRYHRLYDRYFFKGTQPEASPEENRVEVRKVKAVQPKPEAQRGGRPPARLSHTLEEQLRGKDLDLFNRPEQGDQNE